MRDECFSVNATRRRRLTQDRANDGNRGKAIRGGIATFSFGELNSAGGSVFRALQQLHRNLPIRLTSTEGAGRCRHGGLLVGIGRGDHEMRSAGRSVSIAIGRSSNGRRPTHSFGLRTHGDVA